MSEPNCPLIVTMGRDHLVESCPHYRLDVRDGGGFSEPCAVRSCDPLAETVCGWCKRVWAARNLRSTLSKGADE